jgi:hypothetical protein
MRKLIVIAAMVLASATAQAGQTRSLTRADVQVAATDPAKPVDGSKTSEVTKSSEAATAPDVAKPADPPKFVERPPAVEPTRSQPAPTAATQPSPADVTTPSTAKAARADKPRHKQRYWTESRIIGELHRHGIYW